MSDGSISQDEIDALLSGGSSSSTSSPSPSKEMVVQAGFDGLAKFASGNVPSFSTKLGSATSASASISLLAVEEREKEGFLKQLPDMVVATYIDFSGMMQGGHTFVLAEGLAKKIIELENHEKDVEIDDMGLSIISEGISQFVGAEVTALEVASLKGVVSSTPNSVHIPKAALNLPLANFISIGYTVKLVDEDYKMWEVFASDVANKIEETISGPKNTPQSSTAPNMMQGMPQMAGQMNGGQFMMGQGGMPVMNNPNVQPVQFSQLQNFTSQAEAGNIGLIMDVYMEMTVELGRTKKMIKEILGMGEGHIIELDKLAGEPVDILVNHKPIAKGEVVVIEENFGVRVTEILSPSERISDV